MEIDPNSLSKQKIVSIGGQYQIYQQILLTTYSTKHIIVQKIVYNGQ